MNLSGHALWQPGYLRLMVAMTVGAQGVSLFVTTLHYPLAPYLVAEFALTPAQWGLLAAAVQLGGGLTTWLAGWLADRLPLRQMLFGSFFSSGLLLVLVGSVPGLVYPALVAALVGVGICLSCISPIASKGVGLLVPPARQGTVFGIRQSLSVVGQATAAVAMPVLAFFLGWRSAMVVVGGLVCMNGLAYRRYYAVVAPPAPAGPPGQARGAAIHRLLGLLSPALLVTMAIGAVFTGAQMGVTAFLIPYLTNELGLSAPVAGSYLALMLTAGVITRPLVGMVSDAWFAERRVTLLALIAVLGALAVVLLTLVHRGDNPVWLVPVTAALGVFLFSWAGVQWALLAKLSGLSRFGTVAGMASTLMKLGGAAGTASLGYLMDLTGSSRLPLQLLAGAVFGLGLLFALLPLESAAAEP